MHNMFKLSKFAEMLSQKIAFRSPHMSDEQIEFSKALKTFNYNKAFEMLDNGYECNTEQKTIIVGRVVNVFKGLAINKAKGPSVETNISSYPNKKITNDDAFYLTLTAKYPIASMAIVLSLINETPKAINNLSLQHLTQSCQSITMTRDFISKKELAESYVISYALEMRKIANNGNVIDDHISQRTKAIIKSKLTPEAESLDFTKLIDSKANENLKNNFSHFIDGSAHFYPNFIIPTEHFNDQVDSNFTVEMFNKNNHQTNFFTKEIDGRINPKGLSTVKSTNDLQGLLSHYLKMSFENSLTPNLASCMALESGAVFLHAWISNISYNNPLLPVVVPDILSLNKLKDLSGEGLRKNMEKSNSQDEFLAHHVYKHIHLVTAADIQDMQNRHEEKVKLTRTTPLEMKTIQEQLKSSKLPEKTILNLVKLHNYVDSFQKSPVIDKSLYSTVNLVEQFLLNAIKINDDNDKLILKTSEKILGKLGLESEKTPRFKKK